MLGIKIIHYYGKGKRFLSGSDNVFIKFATKITQHAIPSNAMGYFL